MRCHTLLFSLLLVAGASPQTPPPPAIPDTVPIEKNIPYDHYPATVLDIVQPKEAAQGKRPGVLVIHGGGWTGGTKESVFQNFCLPYVEKGFVCANVEYRLAKAALAPAAVTDSLDAA